MQAHRVVKPVFPTPSDIDVSNAYPPVNIGLVAADAGLLPDEISMYGPTKAKVLPSAFERLKSGPDGAYVVISALTPTKYGEGKSTTTLGLTQALGTHLKKTVIACVRQPSMGPTFGIKGGAAGGGYAQAIPMPEFNLHLTGDIHAISAANNLMCAAMDTRIFHEATQPTAALFRRLTTDGSNKRNFAPQHAHRLAKLGIIASPTAPLPSPESLSEEDAARFARLDIDLDTIAIHRVVDINDRALRAVETCRGSEEAGKGAGRIERFEIAVASEVMGVIALAADLHDLRRRLGKIVVARSKNGEDITADDLGVAGAMCVILKDAIQPTLMQTLEGNPVLVHAGPFGNIAHGNSSIVADRVALKLVGADGFVLTEAGFGADMGLEKFVNIKSRISGLRPAVAVIVATVRAVKAHDSLDENDLTRGFANLERHIKNAQRFGLKVVAVVNKFANDSEDDLATLISLCEGAGAFRAVVSNHFGLGGAGAIDAASAVVEAAEAARASPTPLALTYADSESLVSKITAVVTKVYGGEGIDLSDTAKAQLEALEAAGHGSLPVCMAKTQYSFSHDAALKGAPTGFRVPVREAFLNAGAGFIVVMCGPISRMPGLATRPAYMHIDIDESGEIVGLS